MKVTHIPFVQHVGIEHKDEKTLQLEATKEVKNHIDTIHASAQFTLAESQSGLFLQQLFPEYVREVVPLLRSSSLKYKAPALKDIYATATVSNEEKEKFLTRFTKKGRATIVVNVEIKDSDEVLTMQGEFNWFVQKLEL